MKPGLDGFRAALLVVVFAAGFGTLGLASCSSSSGSEDRVVRLALSFEDPVPPHESKLKLEFSGYVPVEIPLGPPLKWNPDDASIDLDVRLPGFGSDHSVNIMVSVDTDPPLSASASGHLLDSAPIVIVLRRVKVEPALDGGMDGATDRGSGDGGTDQLGTDGTDDAASEHPTVVGPGDGGADADDGGGGTVECDGSADDHGTTAVIPTCTEYCGVLVAHCGPPFSDNCMNICAGLRWDAIPIPAQSTARNNLRCRIDQANQARLSAPEDGADFCAAATWNGMASGGCGTPCQVYCDAGKANCGGAAMFSDPIECFTACRTFTSTNLNCRVDALVQAGLGINAAESCTSASQGSGCPP